MGALDGAADRIAGDSNQSISLETVASVPVARMKVRMTLSFRPAQLWTRHQTDRLFLWP